MSHSDAEPLLCAWKQVQSEKQLSMKDGTHEANVSFCFCGVVPPPKATFHVGSGNVFFSTVPFVVQSIYSFNMSRMLAVVVHFGTGLTAHLPPICPHFPPFSHFPLFSEGVRGIGEFRTRVSWSIATA